MSTVQIRRRFKRQKVQAVRLRISDVGFSENPIKLTGLSIEYGIKAGLNKIPHTSNQG